MMSARNKIKKKLAILSNKMLKVIAINLRKMIHCHVCCAPWVYCKSRTWRQIKFGAQASGNFIRRALSKRFKVRHPEFFKVFLKGIGIKTEGWFNPEAFRGVSPYQELKGVQFGELVTQTPKSQTPGKKCCNRNKDKCPYRTQRVNDKRFFQEEEKHPKINRNQHHPEKRQKALRGSFSQRNLATNLLFSLWHKTLPYLFKIIFVFFCCQHKKALLK